MATYTSIRRTTANLLTVGGIAISNSNTGTQIDLDSSTVKSDLLKNIGAYEFIIDPIQHSSTHAPGGTDALAVDAAIGIGSLRTLGTGAVQAAAGNDVRFIRPATIGNRVSMIGDSITIGNSVFNSTNQARGDRDPLNWASLLSNSKLVYQTNAGIGGNNAAQMLARVQTDIITPGCDVCVVMSGSNDAQQTVSVASYAASITGIVTALIAAGIKPVLCTSPPLVSTPVTSPTRRRLWDSYNAWLAIYCQRNYIPLVPIQNLMTDPANGDWLAAYSAGDGYHANAAGSKVMGQAIANVIMPLVGANTPPIATFETSDALNLLAGGLFQVDTNVDGVADNWLKSGATAVATTVTDAAISGKWQRMTDTVSQTTQIAPFPLPTGWAIGDRLALAGRFRNDSTGGTVSIQWYMNASSPSVSIRLGTFSVTVPDTLFYMEAIVPAGTTSIQPALIVGGSTALDARMAQMKMINLTALGL